MKVLFAASECVPFVKTGGLADVVGALPKEIQKTGAEVRVILPLYRSVEQYWRDQMEYVLYYYVDLGWRHQYVGLFKLVYDGVTFYFIDNEQYFGREYIYGMGGDEGERFAFFSRAVLEVLPKIDYIPDVLHCHDWQTGMIPVLHKLQYKHLELYRNIRDVYTIHNLQYQGIFPINTIEEMLRLGDLAYTSDSLEFFGMCSFMKGGLVYADEITTVSPTYSEEIKSAYYGERMDGLLRARENSLTGILNGIDVNEYNPETDDRIARNFNADNFHLKIENKLALQQELGLTVNPDIPMIGMVGRLASQKGLDLVECVLGGIMNTGAQLVILGMGESKYVDLFSWAHWKYPNQVAACFQMNHGLAHMIYASCDLFLMPSMFEPCGLSQLISLRYGTLPIVRETGGLRDTVLSYNEFNGEGNGFTFFNYNAHDMLYVIEQALDMYYNNRGLFNHLASRAMRGLYGWDQSALKYVELYNRMIENMPDFPMENIFSENTAEIPVEIEEKPAPKKPAARNTASKKAETAEATEKKPAARKTASKKAETAEVTEKKPAARKTASKKAETAEATEKKPAARKTASKKAETAEAAEKKPAARKTASKKAETAEATEKKPAARKTASKKAETAETTAKKPATRKTASKKAAAEITEPQAVDTVAEKPAE